MYTLTSIRKIKAALLDLQRLTLVHYRFLRQEYSWGRLLITRDTFASIRESYDAFIQLDDHISSFRLKTSDCDEHFAKCDQQIYFAPADCPSNHSYHGTTFSFDQRYAINPKLNLGFGRDVLSTSLPSATWAKERMPVFYSPNGNIPSL